MLAADNNRLDVDFLLRYRIVDPFDTRSDATHSPDLANGQLGFILNLAVRRVLSEADMTETCGTTRADLDVRRSASR